MPTIWLKNIFIVAFFGVQLSMAAPGLLYNKYETYGYFSWNMYSMRYTCKLHYDLIRTNGEIVKIKYREFFNSPYRAHLVLHRDDLPKLNKYVCDEERHRGRLGIIHASVACILNYRQPVQFIKPGVDICTASNYGVRPR